jgi:GDP-4-dehydro-6-deoxy-D-mannose reductase
VVKIYWHLIQTSLAYGEIINVCSGQGTVIKDLLEKLVELSTINVDIRTDSARFKPVDVPVHYGSVEKLQRLLGYTPQTNLESVLKSIIMQTKASY